MDIGTGIAIAGVWIFAGMTLQRGRPSLMGYIITVWIAIAVTLFLNGL